MVAASHLIRSIVVGAAALGLAVSSVCAPLSGGACKLSASDARTQQCCCGENCQCGATCGQTSPANDRQQSTTAVQDQRDLGKISGQGSLMASHFGDSQFVSPRSAPHRATVIWSSALVDQHTCLQV